MKIALVIGAAVALAAVAHAQQVEPDAPAPIKTARTAPAEPEHLKRGYWFYEKPKTKEETAEVEPVTPLGAPPKEDDLLQMHPTQVAKLIEEYRQYALYTMQPEQVQWYFTLQDFARRRSRAFMNVTELVMLNNPQLNMNTEYPTNVPGSNARVARRESTTQTRLARERGKAALVMLSSPSCGFCEAQRGTLKFFQQKHGWTVREFNIQERPDLVAKFGTNSTPTTFVVFSETGDWMPVAVGVESVPRIEENTYRAIRMVHGETTAEQFTMQEHEDGGLLDPTRRGQ